MESVKTALRLIELIAQVGRAGVSELSRRMDEPKPTIQRHLLTLHEAGWLRAETQGRRRQWTLSAKVIGLSATVEHYPSLRRAALPVMEQLRQETRETIHLMMRDGDHVVLIERLISPQTLRIVRPLGARAPLHVASNGKAILAALTPEERERYLQEDLTAWTPMTLTDPRKIAAELKKIQAAGYAINREELDEEIRAVAASIRAPKGEPIASVSISCPATRLPARLFKVYGARVRDAAARIEHELGNSGSPNALG